MAEGALIAARALAEGIDPAEAAARVGAGFDAAARVATLAFLGDEVSVAWPAIEVSAERMVLPPHVQALIVYHLAMSDGTRPTGELLSFADLPSGREYVSAFRGYTGAALVRAFGDDADVLGAALGALGGEPVAGVADAAWFVPALPRVPITVALWAGDDEFEPRIELLFDATASHHLPTDGCAVLGSWLTAMASRGAPQSG